MSFFRVLHSYGLHTIQIPKATEEYSCQFCLVKRQRKKTSLNNAAFPSCGNIGLMVLIPGFKFPRKLKVELKIWSLANIYYGSVTWFYFKIINLDHRNCLSIFINLFLSQQPSASRLTIHISIFQSSFISSKIFYLKWSVLIWLD